MQIELIDQQVMEGFDRPINRVILNQVDSPCILSRLLTKALGRPGIDTDMELVGGGMRWTIMWTEPEFDLPEIRELIMNAIAN